LYLRWQDAAEDMKAARDPLEAKFFADQEAIDKEALFQYDKIPEMGLKYLTNYSLSCQKEAMEMYQELQKTLITKYTNNKQGL
jgi:dipeptidase